MSSAHLKITGDPRRPQEIRRYVPPKPPEDQAGDFRLVGAMMFGLAAMLTKVPWFGWLGIALCLAYLSNMSSRDYDIKAIMSSIFFSIFGLLGSYASHLRPFG